jgi:tRNA(Ile)-lysidine synthase
MAETRRAVREWGEKHAGLPNRTWLVALSGGGDSLALAWAASVELPKLSLSVGAVVVDHQVQEGSAEHAKSAMASATALGLRPVVLKTVTVDGPGGPEDAARTARYRAFSEVLAETGAGGILLGHTEDDQAETVLMGLARGSGPASLKGMSAHDGIVHRPLLGVSRAILRQALQDVGLSWWDDPQNSNSRFTRVRVRTQVMPLLEDALGPGIASSLARTAELFREDSHALEQLARNLFERTVVRHASGHCSVAVADLLEQPEALRIRVLRAMVHAVGGGQVGYRQTRAMHALVSEWQGQSAVSMPGASLERVGGELHVRATR